MQKFWIHITHVSDPSISQILPEDSIWKTISWWLNQSMDLQGGRDKEIFFFNLEKINPA